MSMEFDCCKGHSFDPVDGICPFCHKQLQELNEKLQKIIADFEKYYGISDIDGGDSILENGKALENK